MTGQWGFLTILAVGFGCSLESTGNKTTGGNDAANADAVPTVVGCAPGTEESIFVLDTSGNFGRFLPATNSFEKITKLFCPDVGEFVTGFSMAVQRNGQAWINTGAGKFRLVNTRTGECTRISGLEDRVGNWGMEFVANSPGSDQEKLFLSTTAQGDAQIVVVDPQTLSFTDVGYIRGGTDFGPELTGTGDAELYGYFPDWTTSKIILANKDDASIITEWPFSPIRGISAWSFAHFGGKLYVFRSGGGGNEVIEFDPATGKERTIVADSDWVVSGAGVSTCAPTVNPE